MYVGRTGMDPWSDDFAALDLGGIESDLVGCGLDLAAGNEESGFRCVLNLILAELVRRGVPEQDLPRYLSMTCAQAVTALGLPSQLCSLISGSRWTRFRSFVLAQIGYEGAVAVPEGGGAGRVAGSQFSLVGTGPDGQAEVQTVCVHNTDPEKSVTVRPGGGGCPAGYGGQKGFKVVKAPIRSKLEMQRVKVSDPGVQKTDEASPEQKEKRKQALMLIGGALVLSGLGALLWWVTRPERTLHGGVTRRPPSKREQVARLLRAPCPVCGQVQILDQDKDGWVGATCRCGADAGAGYRWDLRDLPRRKPSLCGVETQLGASKHRHRVLPGSAWGEGSGTVGADCAYHRYDRPCPVRGAHVHVNCRCGAHGVICPMTKKIQWYSRSERF